MQTGTPELDLFIMDSHDIRLLVVADISKYPTSFTIVSPTVTIKIPGYPKEKLVPFVPNNINVFNSNTLDITAYQYLELPDGIYTIKYAIAPAYKYNISKNFLRVEKLYQKFDEKFLSLEAFQCDMQTKRNKKLLVDEIEDYIQGAIAAGNRCANELAMELYYKADNLLNQLQ